MSRSFAIRSSSNPRWTERSSSARSPMSSWRRAPLRFDRPASVYANEHRIACNDLAEQAQDQGNRAFRAAGRDATCDELGGGGADGTGSLSACGARGRFGKPQRLRQRKSEAPPSERRPASRRFSSASPRWPGWLDGLVLKVSDPARVPVDAYTIIALAKGKLAELRGFVDGSARAGVARVRMIQAAPELGHAQLRRGGKVIAKKAPYGMAHRLRRPGTRQLQGHCREPVQWKTAFNRKRVRGRGKRHDRGAGRLARRAGALGARRRFHAGSCRGPGNRARRSHHFQRRDPLALGIARGARSRNPRRAHSSLRIAGRRSRCRLLGALP